MEINTKNMQLHGHNLCDMECVDRGSIIHPETCMQQVLTDNSNNQSLEDWITTNPSTEPEAQPFAVEGSLKEWLINNHSVGYELPTAAANVKGGIKIGQYLTINNEILSVDKSSLAIPDYGVASYENLGVIKLGNDTPIPGGFVTNNTLSDTDCEIYPLRKDSNNKAGIVFPTLAKVATSGSYNDLDDTPTIPYAQIQSDWNQSDDTAKDYIKNKPTIVDYIAGEGINVTGTTISQTAATSASLGGIKLGYTKEGNKKPVQLDSNNKAYVDTEQNPVVGHMITNGLSAKMFILDSNYDNKWIPIVRSVSTNLQKCSVMFEIYFREDSGTGYAKYYLNHREDLCNDLLCTSYWVNTRTVSDTPQTIFGFDDIKVAKHTKAIEGDITQVILTVYVKVRRVQTTYSMFLVNVLAENTSDYSTQTYFTTYGDASTDDTVLTSSDGRLGTYSTNSMVAKIDKDDTTPIAMPTIDPINGTFYNPQS